MAQRPPTPRARSEHGDGSARVREDARAGEARDAGAHHYHPLLFTIDPGHGPPVIAKARDWVEAIPGLCPQTPGHGTGYPSAASIEVTAISGRPTMAV